MAAIVPPDSSTLRRVSTLAIGLLLIAPGVACMIRAELGVAPYDVLTTGLSEVFDLPIGVAAIALPVVFVAIGILLGGRLRYGTVLCTILVGPILGLTVDLLPELHAMAPRIALYAFGLGILSVGITATVAADIGAGPAEMVMVALHQRGPGLAVARTGIELVCVLIGWALGGQVGVGTLVFAAVIGATLRRTLTFAGFSAEAAAEASDLAAPGA